jgi:NAD-dependent dihydropyrimidine dehydrogenase PreA subunit
MKRKIITINHEKCSGCGMCVPDCPEGALQVIEGKARLVGDLLCDGLGACIQSCPENAISVEEREAQPYDEAKALETIIPQGRNVIVAHLKHLKEHGQTEFLKQALSHLSQHGVPVDFPIEANPQPDMRSCPGSKTLAFPSRQEEMEEGPNRPSRLAHWPVQLHLISPSAPHYHHSHLLMAADCVAYAYADFHKDFLKDRTLAIACPKLDSHQEIYLEKLTALIDQAALRSIRVMIMQVPCCNGLLRLVLEAARRAAHKVPVHCVIVGLRGEILSEAPVQTGPAEACAS